MKEAATVITHHYNLRMQSGKKVFVRDLIASVQREVLAKIAQMPEEWDGMELRWYIAEKFTQSTLNTAHDRIRQQRKRDYSNEVAVRNL